MNWRQKGNQPNSLGAYRRALELCDLTISDPKNESQLEELKRIREILVDYFVGDNQFDSTEEQLRNYFDPFSYAARRDY
jgi:hypothetical protein